METKNRYDGVDVRVVSTIRYHARRLARSRVVPSMELADLEQDIVLDLLHRTRWFDPARGSFPTFADRIIGNRVASLTAPTLRLKTERGMISLDEPAPAGDDDEPCTLGELLSDDARLHADPGCSFEDAHWLRHDVRGFVASLTPALQRCAEILASEHIAVSARAAGLHRSTVYESASRLREKARRAGLDVYLSRTPTVANRDR